MERDVKTFIFMGRPGSGKSVQATRLAHLIDYPIFSSGSRARELAATNSYFGERVAALINEGNLLPSWLAAYFFEEAVLALPLGKGLILEGAARTLPEAIEFDEVMQWLERPYRVFNLDVSSEVVKERLLKRHGLEGRKDDESPERVQHRLSRYSEETLPALEHFRALGKVTDIDGGQPPEEVFEAIKRAVGL